MEQQWYMMLSGLEPDELGMIQNLTRDMSDTQKQQFYSLYVGKRKKQQDLLILAIIGFFGVAGIHRFAVGEIGMGILYLVTIGFCGIGTIIDLINIRQIAANHNEKQAVETSNMVRMMMR